MKTLDQCILCNIGLTALQSIETVKSHVWQYIVDYFDNHGKTISIDSVKDAAKELIKSWDSKHA